MKTLAVTFLTIPLGMLALSAFPVRKPVRQQVSSPHEWLQKLAGDWRVGGEAVAGEGEGAVNPVATESVRPIGRYWIVSEGKVASGAGSITYMRTLGFDPETRSVVGTWVDSTSAHLWVYSSGSLDAEGKTLTLEAEGPGFTGETALFREVIALDGAARVHENFVQGKDGTWTSFEKSVYVREE